MSGCISGIDLRYIARGEETLAAMRDAVETLRRLVAATDPYGLDNENMPFDAHTEFAATIFRAKEVLARFDLGDIV